MWTEGQATLWIEGADGGKPPRTRVFFGALKRIGHVGNRERSGCAGLRGPGSRKGQTGVLESTMKSLTMRGEDSALSRKG